jgi:class 3 adenylate cyclase
MARILDLGSDTDDEVDLRIRKRAAVATALVLLAVSILIGVIDLVRGASSRQAASTGLRTTLPGSSSSRSGPCSSSVGTRPCRRLARSSWASSRPWLSTLDPRGSTRTIADDDGLLGHPPDRVPTAIALGLVVFIDGERVRAKAESEALLLNVLPPSIADRLKQGERVIADHHDAVTVLFADLVDFTPFAAQAAPAAVVALLDEIFSSFDVLAERRGLEKIKTIGDSYMVVAGLPEPRSDHALAIVELGIAMHAAVNAAAGPRGYPLRLRTGNASGPAVAGVIGQRKFSYDVWGDAVNLASRMESTGVPDMIQVADSTWSLCHEHFAFDSRDVEIKGMGTVRAHLLDPRSVAARAQTGPRVVVANMGPRS